MYFFLNAGEDPGFPVGGGANPQEGVPSYDFDIVFQKKTHEIEKFWAVGGAPPP